MVSFIFPLRVFLCTVLFTLGSFGAAQAVDFNFTTPSQPHNPGTGTYGNQLSVTQDGLTVDVTAWTNISGDSFTASQLQVWGTGMGVCNTNEGLNCSQPEHPVDNIGADDFLLFQFSEAVDLSFANIVAWANDYDVSWWAGTGDPLPLTRTGGFSVNGIAETPDFFGGFVDGFNFGSANRNVDLTSATNVDWLLFGALLDDNNDGFKFRSLHATASSVPIPSSFGLFGLGLASFVLWRRQHAG